MSQLSVSIGPSPKYLMTCDREEIFHAFTVRVISDGVEESSETISRRSFPELFEIVDGKRRRRLMGSVWKVGHDCFAYCEARGLRIEVSIRWIFRGTELPRDVLLFYREKFGFSADCGH